MGAINIIISKFLPLKFVLIFIIIFSFTFVTLSQNFTPASAQATGQIMGFVFIDSNLNGIKDGVEEGQKGWQLKLTGVLADDSNFGPVNVRSDSTGHYTFSGLEDGVYSIAAAEIPGWKNTSDNVISNLLVKETTTEIDFGIFKLGKILGLVFNDTNGNMVHDAGDKPVPGWSITLTKDGESFSTLTDSESKFSFNDLEAGIYQLSIDIMGNFVPTLPLNRTYEIIIEHNTFEIKKFGIFKNPDDLLAGFGDIIHFYTEEITVDSQGFFYVVDTINGLVKKFDSNGNLVNGFGGRGSGLGKFSRPSGIAIDSLGNIFVSDLDKHIQKFDENGNFLLKWGTLGSDPGQFLNAKGLAVDGNDNVYVSDGNNNRIQKFDSVGNYIATLTSPGVPLGYTRLPFDVAVDSQDNLYIADTGNDRIQKFDSEGNYISSISKFSSPSIDFNRPRAVAVGPNDFVYVADTYNNQIQVFDNFHNFVMAFGSIGAAAGEFGNPSGLVLDQSGRLFVVDSSNDRVQIFDVTTGQFLSEFRTRPSPIEPYFITFDESGNLYTSDGHSHKILKFDPDTDELLSEFGELGVNAGEFRGPRGIAIDSSGNFYVADNYNSRIQKFDSLGNFLLQWGSTGSAEGQFIQVRGLVIDSEGNLLVADTQNNRIQKFDTNGNFISSFDSFLPYQIALDNVGNIYVAEQTANHVTKYNENGIQMMTIGSFGSGPGELDNPKGVYVASSGDIYIADSGENNRIQKFDSAGNLLVMVDTFASPIPNFANPRGIVLDNQNNLWVDDTSNLRILKFDSDLNFIKEISHLTGNLDTNPPIVNVPEDITKEATTTQGTIVVYPEVFAIDDTDGLIIPACSPPSGQFLLGTSTVTCEAIDSSGNVGSNSFLITVEDTTPPSLLVPDGITLSAENPSGAVVNYDVKSIDIVDGSQFTSLSPWSLAIFFAIVDPSTITINTVSPYLESTDFVPNPRDETLFSLFPNQIGVTVEPSHQSIQNKISIVESWTLKPEIISYDIETWEFTPLDEQENAMESIQQAANFVHFSGYDFGTTPSADILFGIFQNLDWNQVEFVVIQLQSFVSNIDNFVSLTNQISSHIKSINPSTIVLVQVDMQSTPNLLIPALSNVRESQVDGVSILWNQFIEDQDLEQVVKYVKVGDSSGFGSLTCTPESGSLFPVGQTMIICIALDSSGNSVSNSFSIDVQPIVPNPINDLILSIISISQVDLNWTAPDNGGSPILGYQIFRNLNDSGFKPLTIISGTEITSFSDNSLSGGDTVNYAVKAVNEIGTSSISNIPGPVTT